MATAVLMHGEINGTGKSLLWERIYRPIFGRYGATLGQHQLESQYTDWRSRKLFVLFEEIATRAEKFNQMGTVKHMITSESHRINQKFVSEWEEQNHMNIVILSNEHQPLPLDSTDRRFLVIWTALLMDALRQAALAREIENGGVEAFYHFLLHRDLGDFGPHTKPPITPAKQRLIHYSLSPIDHFWREWQEGLLDYAPWCTARTQDVYAAFRRYCNATGQRELSGPKAIAILGGRIKKGVFWHTAEGHRKQASLFEIPKPARDALAREKYESDEQWRGHCVTYFEQRLRD
jgi:putative DNA primase/helicase